MALITEQIYGYLSAMDKAHLTLYPAEWYEENEKEIYPTLSNKYPHFSINDIV